MPKIVLIENNYPTTESLYRVLNYVLRSDLIGGYALDPVHAYRQMMMLKKAYHKTDGAQLVHFIISFSSKEAYKMTMDEMLHLGFWAAAQFQSFQAAYALHCDTCHFHLHIVLNTVSYEDGHRYADGLAGFWKLQHALQQVFPKSDVGLYRSYSCSSVNRYMGVEDSDSFLRMG